MVYPVHRRRVFSTRYTPLVAHDDARARLDLILRHGASSFARNTIEKCLRLRTDDRKNVIVKRLRRHRADDTFEMVAQPRAQIDCVRERIGAG